MSATGGPLELDRAMVLRAFAMMADILRQERVRGEILLAGGAVMSLAYDADRVTRDVDGLVLAEHGAVMRAAHLVAGQLRWPQGWLNEGVSVYLSQAADEARTAIFDHPHLAVFAVSAEHLLALKVRAARAQDLPDIRTLADVLDLRSAPAVFDSHNAFFPDDPLSARSVAVIEDLFGA